MPSLAAKQILAKWPLLVKYGSTEKVIYQEMGDSNYDGNVVTNPVVSSHNLDIVIDTISTTGKGKFDDMAIKSIDLVAIFPILLLPMEAKIGDLIVMSSLDEWTVLQVTFDPMKAVYELWIRPNKEV